MIAAALRRSSRFRGPDPRQRESRRQSFHAVPDGTEDVHAAHAGPIGPRRARWDGISVAAAVPAIVSSEAHGFSPCGTWRRSEAPAIAGPMSARSWAVRCSPWPGWCRRPASSAWLGWVATLLLVYGVRAGRAYLPTYCAGLVAHVVGFYWVYQTVRVFGGFGLPAAALVFAIFVVLGALQFLLFALIDRHLDPAFDTLALRSATAVVLSELLMPRLFPWHFGHTQIAFTPFVQIAGLGGAMAVSFLMFWLAEAVVRFVIFRERRWILGLPVVLFGLAMAYGAAMMGTFRSPPGVPQEVVLVQGNATLIEKRDLASAQQNLVRIFDLSAAAAHPGTLIVWPEGSVPAYIPATVGAVGYPPILPWIGDGSAFLVGSYSFLPDEERFNAAFAVYPDGTVPFPYFKRVLIPFGEYMPLASYFPALKKLNAKAGVFTPGTEAQVFAYPMRQPDGTAYTLKVSPLICYEDTVPDLARESTRKGAELLVNITSDSWFGRTLGPAPASPYRRVPSDREPAIPDPRDQHRLERNRLSPRQDHRADSSIHRRDCHGEGELARLPKRLYLLDRRPAMVDTPGVELGNDRCETLSRDLRQARLGTNRGVSVTPREGSMPSCVEPLTDRATTRLESSRPSALRLRGQPRWTPVEASARSHDAKSADRARNARVSRGRRGGGR